MHRMSSPLCDHFHYLHFYIHTAKPNIVNSLDNKSKHGIHLDRSYSHPIRQSKHLADDRVGGDQCHPSGGLSTELCVNVTANNTTKRGRKHSILQTEKPKKLYNVL